MSEFDFLVHLVVCSTFYVFIGGFAGFFAFFMGFHPNIRIVDKGETDWGFGFRPLADCSVGELIETVIYLPFTVFCLFACALGKSIEFIYKRSGLEAVMNWKPFKKD